MIACTEADVAASRVDSAPSSLADAEELLRTHRAERAVECLDRLLLQSPDDAQVHATRGIALASLSRVCEAVGAFSEAVRLSPDAPRLRNLGVARLTLGNREQAIEAFQNAVQADPAYIDAYRLLAQAYGSAGRHAESALVLQQAVLRDADGAHQLRLDLAVAHLRAGQFSDVERELDVVLASHPQDVHALACLAVLREIQGRSVEADAQFDLAFWTHREKPGMWPQAFAQDLARLGLRHEQANTGTHQCLIPDTTLPEQGAGPLLTVLIGCYGDFPHYSLRCLESVLAGVGIEAMCEIWVGLNAACEQTVRAAEDAAAAGRIAGLVRSQRNLNKDPMMRLLLEQARTPYVLWLDDDSHFVDAGWAAAMERFIRERHPFDVAGQLARWGPHRERDPTYMRFIRQRPWWKTERHLPPQLREWAPFVVGGMFLARTNFLRLHDFPDRGMVKAMDDVALGELVLQRGGLQLGLPPEVLQTVRISDGVRRGENYELAPNDSIQSVKKPRVDRT